jgi:acetoin utilization deacetylase AcuC-like enzyme
MRSVLPAHLRPLAVVDDRRFDRHTPPGYHPERVERLDAARDGLRRAVPASRRLDIAADRASEDDLVAVHAEGYLRRLGAALRDGRGHLDADTYYSPGTHDAAWTAAGGAARLARHLMRQAEAAGLALLRPPGHHATPDAAMGFCLLNNVAVAAAAALRAGAARVAIVDWDVHHGNGTEAAFYEDPDVLVVSLHQWPLYPGTGAPEDVGRGAGAGRNVNVALPAGSGPETYAHAMRRVVLPLLERFAPDVVLVSAGFDAHARDPLGGMALDAATYAAMASALVSAQQARGAGRVAALLEGGYDLRALEESVAATAGALLGEVTPLPEDVAPPAGRDAVARTIAALAPHWPGLFDAGSEAGSADAHR